MRYNSGVCLSRTNIIKAGKDLFLYHRGKEWVTLIVQKIIESNVKLLREREREECERGEMCHRNSEKVGR